MPINPILGRQAFQPTSLAAAMMQRGQRIEEEAQARAKPWAAVAERAGAGAKEALEAHQIEQAERPGKLFNLLSQQKQLEQMDTALAGDEAKLDQDYAENTLKGIDRIVRQAVNLNETEEKTEIFFREQMEALRETGLGNISRHKDEAPHPETDWVSLKNLKSRYAAMIDPDLVEEPAYDDQGNPIGVKSSLEIADAVRGVQPDWEMVEVRVPNTKKELVLQFDSANNRYFYPREHAGQAPREAFGPFDTIKSDRRIFQQTTYMYDPLFGANRPVIRTNDDLRYYDSNTGLAFPQDVVARLQQPLDTQENAKLRAAKQMKNMLRRMEELGFRGENPIFAGEGLGHKFTNAFRALKAYAGYDPDMRLMMSLRTAAAAQAAVTQQGARPSDFDTKGTWLPLVPHGVWNTKKEAEMMLGVLHEWVDATNRPLLDWRDPKGLTTIPPNTTAEFRNQATKQYMDEQKRRFNDSGVKVGDLMIGQRAIRDENGRVTGTFYDEYGRTQPQFFRAHQNAPNYAGGDWRPFNTKEQVVETLIANPDFLSPDGTPLRDLDQAEAERLAGAMYDEIMEADAAEVTKALDDPSFAGSTFYTP